MVENSESRAGRTLDADAGDFCRDAALVQGVETKETLDQSPIAQLRASPETSLISGGQMPGLRTACVVALAAVAALAASYEWSGVGMAQERTSPAVRRVITGHDAGKVAKAIMDSPATNSRRGASGSTSTLIWTTDGAPADIAVGEKVEDMGARKLGTAPPR